MAHQDIVNYFQEHVRYPFDWEEHMEADFRAAEGDLVEMIHFLDAINGRHHDVGMIASEHVSAEMVTVAKEKMARLRTMREQVIETLKEHFKAVEKNYQGKSLGKEEFHELLTSFIYLYALSNLDFSHAPNVAKSIKNFNEDSEHFYEMCEFVAAKLKQFGIEKSHHDVREFIHAAKATLAG